MQSDTLPARYAADSGHHAELTDHDHPAMFGFWIYILTDCVLFAALFATYAVLGQNTATGPSSHELFDLPYTLGETFFLLLSSISYGVAMIYMNANRQRGTVMWLVFTALLGLGFLSMEFREFHAMILEGNGPGRSAFLSSFFTLVGTHGTHVSFGLLWMFTMLAQISSKGLTTQVRSRLMRLGLFWHFLDIVWIGVFSIVYLMGVVI